MEQLKEWDPGAVAARSTNGDVLALSCRQGCRFRALSGTPRVPRLSPAPGCSSRVSHPVLLHIEQDGTLFLLGFECRTRAFALETWLPGSGVGRVELLPAPPEPPDSGYRLVNMEIRVDAEGAPWILGLEWFWGGAPGVTASYLAHREAGGWRREAPPCAGEAVVDHLVDLGGEQWLLCGSSLLSRPPGAEFRLRLEDALYDGELAVVAGKLLVQKGGGWFEVVEAGARPSPAE